MNEVWDNVISQEEVLAFKEQFTRNLDSLHELNLDHINRLAEQAKQKIETRYGTNNNLNQINVTRNSE